MFEVTGDSVLDERAESLHESDKVLRALRCYVTYRIDSVFDDLLLDRSHDRRLLKDFARYVERQSSESTTPR